jgi:hypothetical protein
MRAFALVGRPLHPRIAQFVAFLAHISTVDLVAPAHGRRRLHEAFAGRAGALRTAQQPSGISIV